MSLKPPNYFNLFDFLYPESQLVGFEDPSQINVEQLNAKLAVIRANHRSLMQSMSDIAAAADDGTYFRDFILPYYEVAASRRFVYDSGQMTTQAFTTGFDASGSGLTFGEVRTVFYLNDLGGELLSWSGVSEASSVLVYSGQLLIDASDFTVTTVQGGAIVYVKTSKVTAGSPVDILIMRQFNRKKVNSGDAGGTWITLPTRTQTGPTTSSPVDLTVSSLSLLGNVYDLSTYRVFHKTAVDTYYRLVDPSDVTSRMADTGDGAVFTIQTGAIIGESHAVVGLASYWDYEWSGTLTASTSQQFKIDLLELDGTTPAPASVASDIDVWVDGRLLRPDTDYCVDMGDPAEPTIPPRVIISGLELGARRVRAVANAPYDAAHNVTLTVPSLSDTRGIIPVSLIGREIRLTDRMGLLFSGGYFDGEGSARAIGDNRALDVSKLSDRTDVYYRARFVLTNAARDVCESVATAGTTIERILDLFGSGSDIAGTILTFDYLSTYAEANSLSDGHVPVGTRPPRDPPFGTGYFWARDRQASRLAAGNFSLDARPRSSIPTLESWAQPVNGPGAGGISFDGRETTDPAGYVNVALDGRGV